MNCEEAEHELINMLYTKLIELTISAEDPIVPLFLHH